MMRLPTTKYISANEANPSQTTANGANLAACTGAGGERENLLIAGAHAGVRVGPSMANLTDLIIRGEQARSSGGLVPLDELGG